MLPVALDDFHLGLLGCLRLDCDVPISFTNKGRERAAGLGFDLIDALNAEDVWANIEFKAPPTDEALAKLVSTRTIPDGATVVLSTRKVFVRLAAFDSSLGVVDATAAPRRLPFLLQARFVAGARGSFRPGQLFSALYVKRTLENKDERAKAMTEESADRRWLKSYRDYLRSVWQWLEENAPTVPYVVESRSPLRISLANPEHEREWPRAFTYPESRIELPLADGRVRFFRLDAVTEDGEVLVLDSHDTAESVAARGTARLKPNTEPVKRMEDALAALADAAHAEHLALLDVLRSRTLVDSAAQPFTPVDLAHRSDENARQHDAVAMALASPDVALIHGPPGTGKTTVICELVRQLIHDGKRVLLVAPTHVALDNVLARIGHKDGVVALRLGARENVDERLRHFLLSERAASLRADLRDRLDRALDGAPQFDAVVSVQQRWRDEVAQSSDPIGELLLLNANLVCATPIGIAMQREFREPEPIFDVMIMDEASKATVVDFLVPATRARKWILVGDHMQLSPYSDQEELLYVLRARIEARGQPVDDEWVQAIAGALRWHYEQRAHPDESVRRKAWRSLLEQALAPEIANAFVNEPANEEIWRARADAWRIGNSARGDPDGLDRTSLSTRADRAALVADVLELQRVSMPSVFETLKHALPANRTIRLDHQHRMAPALAEFSKKWVYRGDYESGQHTRRLGLQIPDLEETSIWIDTRLASNARRWESPRRSEWRGGGYHNPLEVDVVCEVLEKCITWAQQAWRWERDGVAAPFELGVVSFYNVQAARLRDAVFRRFAVGAGRWRRSARLRAANGAAIDLHVSVVDRFQGQEKDVLILSGTRSNPKKVRGHVNNLNRLNVAVTRARHKRIIIGDSSTLVSGPPEDLLRRLYESCEPKLRWGRALTTGGAP